MTVFLFLSLHRLKVLLLAPSEEPLWGTSTQRGVDAKRVLRFGLEHHQSIPKMFPHSLLFFSSAIECNLLVIWQMDKPLILPASVEKCLLTSDSSVTIIT